MTTLQSLPLPSADLPAPEDLFIRFNDRAWVEFDGPRIRFDDGGLAFTDTYYGALQVRVWKTRCEVPRLELRLRGAGRFTVTFGLHRWGRDLWWLGEQKIDLTGGDAATLPVPRWDVLEDGLLFYRLRADGPGVLDEAAYQTPDAPVRDVRLGIVITHFNRQSQVVPGIQRICRGALEKPELQPHLTLTVVDNSRNLPMLVHPQLKRIPNPNLGGSGGFTRGLLDLIDGREHTHALFMDDDASCEPESIARTVALLQYARSPKLAVAGALTEEHRAWHLLEQGARFDLVCRPLCAGLDMRRIDHLLEAARGRSAPHYGGWWFFAFPIAQVSSFPFPFFVRGDDVFFSRSNDFEIETLAGVACQGQPFAEKHGPMTSYLDARYHLLSALLGPRPARSVLRLARELFVRPLAGYQYASARALSLAVEHLLQGPDFFRHNIDMAAIRAEISSWHAEKLEPLDAAALDARGPRARRESKARRWIRCLTLQGFLLPGFLIRERTLRQDKGFFADAASVFRYRRVLYEHAASGTGHIACYDRAAFFRECRRFARALVTLLYRLTALRQSHAQGLSTLATAAFWRGVYDLPAAPVAPRDSCAETPALTRRTPVQLRTQS